MSFNNDQIIIIINIILNAIIYFINQFFFLNEYEKINKLMFQNIVL